MRLVLRHIISFMLSSQSLSELPPGLKFCDRRYTEKEVICSHGEASYKCRAGGIPRN